MRQRVIVGIVYLLAGLVGMGLWTVGIHLYQDHQNLHALVNVELQRQQAMQKPPPEK